MSAHYYIGVDLGQRQDYTAIAVVERAEVLGELDRVRWERRPEARFSLRHVERLKLGTPYPQVVERVRQVATSPKLGGGRTVVADATGVGMPVMDLLRGAGLGCCLVPVLITGGERARSSEGVWRVPKRDLVVGLQVMLEQGALQIARGMAGTEALVDELMNMRVKVSGAGHERFAAWREGTHDDLVLAVALACWRAWGRRPRDRRQGALVE